MQLMWACFSAALESSLFPSYVEFPLSFIPDLFLDLSKLRRLVDSWAGTEGRHTEGGFIETLF